MAQYFIRRPIFAWVIAIIIMLGGALAISTLSIAQYPEIAPTTVQISASYNGASAEQTVFHCHIHLIPRREGDVGNPRGGVRHVIPNKGIYKEN